MVPTPLSPAARRDSLDRLATETFDVLVVGGGVTGAGTALDAATRGLAVGLVEQRDLAAGTSSRSSKLVHGGLRYLEQLHLGLVREALHERTLLLDHLAPHLVRPVPFLFPLTHRVWERAYVGAGVALYDVLAGLAANPLPRHRHLSRRRALQLMPDLRPDAFVGAIRYHDAQVDDARHTATVARTAASHGAAIATSLQVTGLRTSGGAVVGATARCAETGRVIDISARAVVNTTGVWTDHVQQMAGPSTIHVRASKGVHLLVRGDRIRFGSGVISRTAHSVLFVIPWGRYWIIGTTDTDWDLDLAHPAATSTDIQYLLSQVNQLLARPLDLGDVTGVYAGLRPLLHGQSEDTSELSREHAVAKPVPGLITVAGGKYTTYRVMAADAVDAATAGWPGVTRSVTSRIPLVGAAGWEEVRASAPALAAASGLTAVQVEHLLGRYGSLVPEILDLVADDPALAGDVTVDCPYIAAEIVHAASHEGALHLDDVLTRRTRISIESHDRGVGAAPLAARLMAGVLGWDDHTVDQEVHRYVERVEAERASQTHRDDDRAVEARLLAADSRYA